MINKSLVGILLMALPTVSFAHTDSHAKKLKSAKPAALCAEEKDCGRQGDPK
jgi:hypothetical protein